ncbi:MAG: hypothetical protein AB7Y46_12090 [Armatimonadota bacterium]
MASSRRGMTVLGYLIALTALSICLGYVDAVASFSVRGTLEVAQEGANFARVMGEAMPARTVALEQTRQAASVLLLAAVAFVAGRNGLQQWGTFIFTLGAWTVLRYAAIRTITNWPESLASTDLITLLPRPAYVPVWMALVAGLALSGLGVALIRAGALVLRRERR